MQNHTLYFQPFLTYNYTYSNTLKAFWYLPDKSQKMKVNHLDKGDAKKSANQQRCSELQRYPNMCVV